MSAPLCPTSPSHSSPADPGPPTQASSLAAPKPAALLDGNLAVSLYFQGRGQVRNLPVSLYIHMHAYIYIYIYCIHICTTDLTYKAEHTILWPYIYLFFKPFKVLLVVHTWKCTWIEVYSACLAVHRLACTQTRKDDTSNLKSSLPHSPVNWNLCLIHVFCEFHYS